MDESQIIGQFSTPGEQPISAELETAVTDNIDIKSKVELFNLLDINMQLLGDPDTNAHLTDLFEWGKQNGIKADQLLFAINEISSKVGARPDKSKFEMVWDWIKIDIEMKKLQIQKKSLENQNYSRSEERE